MAPDGITFLRFAIGALTLSLFKAARAPIRKSDRAGVVWLGLIWMAFPMSMFPHAEQTVSSALTGMLNGAVPIIATFAAAAIARRTPSPRTLCGLAVGATGAVLMGWTGLHGGTSSARGIALIAVALLAYGVGINLARPLQQRNGALPVVWRAMAVALLATAPLGLPAVANAHWTASSFAAVMALGCLGTAVANAVMAIAAGRLGAARASSTIFLIPVVALALGVIFRGESVPALALTGAAACLFGAWLIRRSQSPTRAPAALPSAGPLPASRLEG